MASSRITPELVRSWAVVIVGIALALGGLLQENATTLMLGTTLLGSEPISRIKDPGKE
jgi:hypothetical protein